MLVEKIHPVYDNYVCNVNGTYRHINGKKWLTGNCDGVYMRCSVSSSSNELKNTSVHRLIYTCFNGVIPDGYEIDHINDNPKDNALINLQCITMQENRKKAQKPEHKLREIAKHAHQLKKQILITNLENGHKILCSAKNQAAQIVGCSTAQVYLICEGKNKTCQGKYTFKYFKENDTYDEITQIPDKRIGVKRVSDEDKIQRRKEATKRYQNSEKGKIALAKALKKRAEKIMNQKNNKK